MTMRGRQNRHYENHQTHTPRLNDDHTVLSSNVDYRGNYSRKHSWNQNQWEETDGGGNHWGSDVCGQKDQWTQYHYREGDGFGKSENQGKWPIKRLLIILVVMILAVVGCWYYTHSSRNTTWLLFWMNKLLSVSCDHFHSDGLKKKSFSAIFCTRHEL